ncbi:MAG: hypothetical protein JRH16_00320 [Deltaproteobacteria bacterium]|nr:hypothetical protein [Deltaproteobacteria bacterium]MBW2359406.1 hypothetical protein [Deltaproteobacteria bacterium]
MSKRVIVTGIRPADLTPARVKREFIALLSDGVEIACAGSARKRPRSLLAKGYTPRHKLSLFDATFYLTNLREDDHFRFFVVYVRIGAERRLHPRIFYKDSSLVWRSPTHYIRSETENWIGKGDLKTTTVDGVEIEYGAEETTNLPFEMQAALDDLSRLGRVRRDHRAIALVLRQAPDGRFEPYRDFSEPRRRAMATPANRIHGGRSVASFARRNDPTSLQFVRGYEPDFDAGVIEESHLRSNLYGGDIRKFRVLSSNCRIQYQFVAGPRHAWIIPPQTLTTELMTYGLRTIDVDADEDIFVPGYEYHFSDDSVDPPELHSQIPEGFAGEASAVDPSRADASPWIDRMPVIQEFRRKLLRR